MIVDHVQFTCLSAFLCLADASLYVLATTLRVHYFALTVVVMASNCGDIVHYARQELISEDKRYAAAHLNETDETRENALAEIRRWIEEIDDLPAQIGKNDKLHSHMIDALSLDEIQI